MKKGSRGLVIAHSEMPCGSMGVSVQFERREDGNAGHVLCRPNEIKVVTKAQLMRDGVVQMQVHLQRAWEGVQCAAFFCHWSFTPPPMRPMSQILSAYSSVSSTWTCTSIFLGLVMTLSCCIPWTEQGLRNVWESIRALSIHYLCEIIPSPSMQLVLESVATRLCASCTWTGTPMLLGVLITCGCCILIGVEQAAQAGSLLINNLWGHSAFDDIAQSSVGASESDNPVKDAFVENCVGRMQVHVAVKEDVGGVVKTMCAQAGGSPVECKAMHEDWWEANQRGALKPWCEKTFDWFANKTGQV